MYGKREQPGAAVPGTHGDHAVTDISLGEPFHQLTTNTPLWKKLRYTALTARIQVWISPCHSPLQHSLAMGLDPHATCPHRCQSESALHAKPRTQCCHATLSRHLLAQLTQCHSSPASLALESLEVAGCVLQPCVELPTQ